MKTYRKLCELIYALKEGKTEIWMYMRKFCAEEISSNLKFVLLQSCILYMYGVHTYSTLPHITWTTLSKLLRIKMRHNFSLIISFSLRLSRVYILVKSHKKRDYYTSNYFIGSCRAGIPTVLLRTLALSVFGPVSFKRSSANSNGVRSWRFVNDECFRMRTRRIKFNYWRWTIVCYEDVEKRTQSSPWIEKPHHIHFLLKKGRDQRSHLSKHVLQCVKNREQLYVTHYAIPEFYWSNLQADQVPKQVVQNVCRTPLTTLGWKLRGTDKTTSSPVIPS